MVNKTLASLARIVTGAFKPDNDDLPPIEAGFGKLERFAHFWVLVWKSFVRNRCPVRAAALSYTTLLALIPMLAVAMSVTSMFLKSEGKEQIETFIQQIVDHMIPSTSTNSIISDDLNGYTDDLVLDVSTNAPIASLASDSRVMVAQEQAAQYIHSFIQNTYSGTLGITGMIFLLFTAILMLTRIEETFNDIWGVTRGRNWLSRVVLYWATITLGPLLLVGAFGLASGPRFEKTRALVTAVPFLEPVMSQLLPVVLICITFALFYKLVPNTKVHFSAAFVGGALAGIAWHFYNMLGFLLASRAVNASKIYGSLALFPLFMGGLYVIWVTVLFGAQVAYAFQNRDVYLQEKLAENVNQRGREFVALRLMTCLGQRFQNGQPPATIVQMSKELGIPSRLVQQVLRTLIAARLVVEVTGSEPAYTPARPIDSINCHHILMAMRVTQGQELITREEPVREEVYGEYARIEDAEKAAASTVTVLALAVRAEERVKLLPPVSPEAPKDMKMSPALTPTKTPAKPSANKKTGHRNA